MEASARDLLRAGASELGVELDGEALDRFDGYLGLLQTWGRKMNLSGRLETDEIVTHHFLDSLSGAAELSSGAGSRVIDIGAGAGFPSLPLKLALPHLEVLLVESSRKKVSFLKEVVRLTRMSGAAAIWARAEEAARRVELQRAFDWCVSRAVAASAAVVELAAPFLVPGGRVLLYKGDPGIEELGALDRLCSATGASWETRAIRVPGITSPRKLIVATLP